MSECRVGADKPGGAGHRSGSLFVALRSACSTLSLRLLFLVEDRCQTFAGTCGPICPPRRIRLVDVRTEQWRPAMVAAPWFNVFSELFRPVTPELAGLALFHCVRGCASSIPSRPTSPGSSSPRISAPITARKAMPPAAHGHPRAAPGTRSPSPSCCAGGRYREPPRRPSTKPSARPASRLLVYS